MPGVIGGGSRPTHVELTRNAQAGNLPAWKEADEVRGL